MANSICPWHSIINFFNDKNFFRLIWMIDFCKNVFIFWYSYLIANFKFRASLIIFFIIFNICASLYINNSHFNCSMILIVVIVNYIMQIINIHIFLFWSHVFINFVFSDSNKSFSNKRFFFVRYWIHVHVNFF